ncbi:MAG: c-type cytochrome [Opitutaceae bacterium]|nr:c-type cytochrome [Opitutaceae bacterium]
MTRFLLSLALALGLTLTAAENPPAKKNAAEKKAKSPTAAPVPSVGVHPFFALENIDTEGGEVFRVGGMAFHQDVLYVTTLQPDRTDKGAFKSGKVLRVENALHAGKAGQKLKVTTLCDWLYEPCAIAVIGDSIYVGEKDRIIRFDDGVHKSSFRKGDETVMLDGISTPNFHTYTIGFEHYRRDGRTFLCGNFSTAILLGGKRNVMSPSNADIRRGSTFILGPVDGREAPGSVKIEYLAGGFRTPNGIEVGPDNTVWVADNQGIFNPSNELIRIEKGKFYGHYLRTNDGRASAFQPADIDAEVGSPKGQAAATVHLQQLAVARSPAQPIVLRNETGVLAPYNGQILLCEFTSGRILRVFTEQVGGVWQGVVFQHTGGPSDQAGNNGFSAGPNRIEQGPDGNFYIGEIGAGGLWEFNGRWQGLQRFRVKSAAEAPADFNEILAVRAVEGGFAIEFLRPIPRDSISLSDIKVGQWTYFPTASYGGKDEGKVMLKPKALTFDATGKIATLIVNGLKDDQDIITDPTGLRSNHNTGWVVQVEFDPRRNGKSLLHTKEFWYTLHRKIGGQPLGAGDVIALTKGEALQQTFQSLCMACHVEREGGAWGAPNLKGIVGRKQTVLRDGQPLEVTVDRAYLINAILHPDAEKTLPFKDVAMPPLGLSAEAAADLADFIARL